MVKPLHPISDIAARLSQIENGQVHLTRAAAAQNGTPYAHLNGSAPRINPLEATVAALAAPIEFPPLAAGIVPGDRIAIAVDEAIPCVAEIVRGAIQSLERAGVESDSISVVSCDSATNQLCRDACTAEASSGVKFVAHDPDDQQNLCWVGATKRGESIVINRTIFDADLVLPIGCARVEGRGAYEHLFPRFSNSEAIRRYRTPSHMESPTENASRLRETKEAGWLVGVPMVVEVVPGAGNTPARVLAGEPNAVARESQQLSEQQWTMESPQQVSLVIATLTGGPESQTWMNVGRALATAEQLVADGGAVAICSNLSERPGRSLARLVGNPDLEAVERKISHDHESDSWPAVQLARALQRGPVYFLSRLSDESVEDLGLAPVERIDDLVRLAQRHESFAIVEDSQNVVVTLSGVADE